MGEQPITDRWGPWHIFQTGFVEKGYLKLLKLRNLKVYIALCRHADIETGRAWPTVTTLMEETGLCRNALYRGLKELKALGLVKAWRHRKDKTQTWGKVFYRVERIDHISTTMMDIYPRTTKKDIYTRERDEKGRFRGSTSHNVVQDLNHKMGHISFTTKQDTNKTKTIFKQDQQENSSFRKVEGNKEEILELLRLKGKAWTENYLRQHNYDPNLINELEA